jgi:hypothetical protein
VHGTKFNQSINQSIIWWWWWWILVSYICFACNIFVWM